ncbi:hypothetical protein D1872_295840 [compost metagenome]
MKFAMSRYFLQMPLQIIDPSANVAAIRLKLALPRSAGTDTASQSGQVFAVSGQPWQQIAQLGQLYLDDPFPRIGALRENVQNQLGTVDNF